MEKHVRNFLDLLRYVDYIKDENYKIQCFLSRLTTYYKENPNICMRKAKVD